MNMHPMEAGQKMKPGYKITDFGKTDQEVEVCNMPKARVKDISLIYKHRMCPPHSWLTHTITIWNLTHNANPYA